jgi:hypothetical protein
MVEKSQNGNYFPLYTLRHVANSWQIPEMDTHSDNGSEWHTDPENPMLGPDGKPCDAAEKPDQFVYSPLDVLLHPPSNSEGYSPDDDLPTAH